MDISKICENDTYRNMSYDDFLVITVRNNFIPMYGCNLQDPITKKMNSEYHISANLDRGLFLTSESHNNKLYESKLYYELNVIMSNQDSDTINKILDLLKESEHIPCCNGNDKSTFAVVYNAENNLLSHLNMLTKRGVYTNNPWQYLDRHNLKIINIDDGRIKLPEYHKNNDWMDKLPKEARYMIGCRN